MLVYKTAYRGSDNYNMWRWFVEGENITVVDHNGNIILISQDFYRDIRASISKGHLILTESCTIDKILNSYED